MMMTIPLWAIAAVVLPAAGWFAGVWYQQRKIEALVLQLKAARQTAAEHANQARRQIGQLQAELAARPAPARRPAAATPAPATDKSTAVDRFQTHEDGFPKTMIGPHGFQPTQLLG